MAWLRPTRRIVPWLPFVVAVALTSGSIAALRLANWPLRGVELTMSSALVVIGALCGLRDPARDFVHALPVPASRRLVHRLAVIVPALAVAIAFVRMLVTTWFAVVPPSPGWAGLTAFGATGVGVYAVLTRRIGARSAEATVVAMVAWLVVAVFSDQIAAPLDLAMPWWRWPVAVATAAVLVTVVATTSGVEA